jgi:hypothetical protein
LNNARGEGGGAGAGRKHGLGEGGGRANAGGGTAQKDPREGGGAHTTTLWCVVVRPSARSSALGVVHQVRELEALRKGPRGVVWRPRRVLDVQETRANRSCERAGSASGAIAKAATGDARDHHAADKTKGGIANATMSKTPLLDAAATSRQRVSRGSWITAGRGAGVEGPRRRVAASARRCDEVGGTRRHVSDVFVRQMNAEHEACFELGQASFAAASGHETLAPRPRARAPCQGLAVSREVNIRRGPGARAGGVCAVAVAGRTCRRRGGPAGRGCSLRGDRAHRLCEARHGPTERRLLMGIAIGAGRAGRCHRRGDALRARGQGRNAETTWSESPREKRQDQRPRPVEVGERGGGVGRRGRTSGSSTTTVGGGAAKNEGGGAPEFRNRERSGGRGARRGRELGGTTQEAHRTRRAQA